MKLVLFFMGMATYLIGTRKALFGQHPEHMYDGIKLATIGLLAEIAAIIMLLIK